MFVACGIWCLADVSSVSPSLEQTILFTPKYPPPPPGLEALIRNITSRFIKPEVVKVCNTFTELANYKT